jgi:hypothetical protein
MIYRRIVTLRERVEKEIRDHKLWCGKTCNTFNPTIYRKARIDQKLDKIVVQTTKSLSHN